MMLTSEYHFQASGFPLTSKDPPTEMEDRVNLDREDDNFWQRMPDQSYS